MDYRAIAINIASRRFASNGGPSLSTYSRNFSWAILSDSTCPALINRPMINARKRVVWLSKFKCLLICNKRILRKASYYNYLHFWPKSMSIFWPEEWVDWSQIGWSVHSIPKIHHPHQWECSKSLIIPHQWPARQYTRFLLHIRLTMPKSERLKLRRSLLTKNCCQ